MNIDIFKDEIYDYFSIMENDYIKFLNKIIIENHQRSIYKLIEQNTDIYSVFHYDSTKLINEKKLLWAVTEIASTQNAIINVDKNFILPFGHYKDVINERKNQESSLTKLDKLKRINNIVEKITNYLKTNNSSSLLINIIKFCEENCEAVIKDTQMLENSEIPHTIFDYKCTKYITNGHNKRYFALQQKDSSKWGLVDSCGQLIAPFIYDDLESLIPKGGDLIFKKIGNYK